MLIKSSAALRDDYDSISKLAHETGQPVYITKEGEGDLVVMDIDAYERERAREKFRTEMLLSEIDSLRGAETIDLDDAMAILRERHQTRDAI